MKLLRTLGAVAALLFVGFLAWRAFTGEGEPGSLLLIGAGIAGLSLLRTRHPVSY